MWSIKFDRVLIRISHRLFSTLPSFRIAPPAVNRTAAANPLPHSASIVNSNRYNENVNSINHQQPSTSQQDVPKFRFQTSEPIKIHSKPISFLEFPPNFFESDHEQRQQMIKQTLNKQQLYTLCTQHTNIAKQHIETVTETSFKNSELLLLLTNL
jgi:hypothetical protein